MAYDITLTNSDGKELLGSDGKLYIDKRLGIVRVTMEVQKYCKTYEKNFKWKSDYWTHFVYKGKQHQKRKALLKLDPVDKLILGV